MQNINKLCQTGAFNLLQFNEAYESIHFNFLTGTPFREILTSRFLVQVCRKNHLAHRVIFKESAERFARFHNFQFTCSLKILVFFFFVESVTERSLHVTGVAYQLSLSPFFSE